MAEVLRNIFEDQLANERKQNGRANKKTGLKCALLTIGKTFQVNSLPQVLG